MIHPTIKVEYEINIKEINFLDTTVYKDIDGKLRTELYRKPSDRQNFLHSRSEHPPALKKSIPYSQDVRVRRFCYNDKDFKESCSQLEETFHSRGYNRNFIDEQIKQVATNPRNDLHKERRGELPNGIPMITTFNRTLPPLSKIINKN